ncbi:hypothetical protein NX722_17360 [Endozoicomonas gorgoniicola]|uniref:Uncharacterized protein n=1 Tax=Endozoicomonas gorgoniicola TaxID=1234144 RepID=A0ABT3MYA8_9GAMM|nr:hypothetical protein [Endozoicomonas gorgoniicola]MCW7554356.1 hypothetical protein [Endozoicomonas gorgoniicola]
MDTINTLFNTSASYGLDAYNKMASLAQTVRDGGASAYSSVMGNVSYADAKNYLYINGSSCYETLKNSAATLYSRTVTDYLPAAEKGFSDLQRISTAFGEKVRKNAPESLQSAFAPSQRTGMSAAVMTVAALPFAVPYLENQMTSYSCGRELSRQKQLQQKVMADATQQTPQEAIDSLEQRSQNLNEAINGRKAILNRSCFSLWNLGKTLLVAGSSFVLAPYVTGAQMGVYAATGLAHMVYRNVSNTSQTRSQIAELESMKTATDQAKGDKDNLKNSLEEAVRLTAENMRVIAEKTQVTQEKAAITADRDDITAQRNQERIQLHNAIQQIGNEKAQLQNRVDENDALLANPDVASLVEAHKVVKDVADKDQEIVEAQRLLDEKQQERNDLIVEKQAKQDEMQQRMDALTRQLAAIN